MTKAVILAGGFGTRLSEETSLRPKPMVEIGGRPILWHVMKIYESHGITDFIICLGYKGYYIKEYFANYFLHNSDVTVDIQKNALEFHRGPQENWKVTLIDTGADTMTGGRIKRILDHVDGETFCMTYGDGVGDVDIGALLKHHENSGKLATVTAVQMPGRFGTLDIVDNNVLSFIEKPHGDGQRINGGFFVLSPEVGKYIEGDDTTWERDPLEKLAAEKQLSAFLHDGFWQPMDTLRDRQQLEHLWQSGQASWKNW